MFFPLFAAGVFLDPVYSESEDVLNTDKRIEEYYQRGNIYYEQGKYKESQEEFNKALQLLDKSKNENSGVLTTEKNDVTENIEIPVNREAGQGEITNKELVDILKTDEQRVNLDYKDVPLFVVLKSLDSTYKLNIVPPQNITGKVTISLMNVTVDEALEAVLTSTGYAYYKKGNLIYIYPVVGLEDASLVTIVLPIKYLTAAQAQDLLLKSLSPKGDIRINETNNSIVVRDYSPIIEKIKMLLDNIDTPPAQVLIEVKIIDVKYEDFKNLGMSLKDVTYSAPGGLFKHADSPYETGEHGGGSDQVAGTINPGGISSGEISITTFTMKNWSADIMLNALIENKQTRILATPSITTLNGKEARIVLGNKIPYAEKTQTTTGTTETVKFVDVGTLLRVTPQISPDGYITMFVHPEVSDTTDEYNDYTGISTTEVDVVVRVRDGETIVIAGLMKNRDVKDKKRIPVLGYLPIISLLFSSSDDEMEQREIAVFITPYIIKETNRKVKFSQEDTSYINTLGIGERMMADNLFEKARNLEMDSGIESRRKDEKTRMAEALDLYKTIASQFPKSNKADEALFRAGKIYYWFYRDRSNAKEMFKTLMENYPKSVYCKKSTYIVKSIEKNCKNK